MSTHEDLVVPGETEGLLRLFSPVRSRHVPGCVGVILRLRDNGTADVCWLGKSTGEGDEIERLVNLEDLGLRLDVPTGCVHAAWWAIPKAPTGINQAMTAEEFRKARKNYHLLVAAAMGHGIDPEELRQVVVHIAGLS